MIRGLLISAALPACFAFQAEMLPRAAFAESIGGVVGVIRDSGTGSPVARAQILAHNVNSGTNYAGVSGPNGGLTIAMPPGTYQITASKDGFTRTSSTVKVSSGKMSQFDTIMAPVPVSSAQLAAELLMMKARIDQLEAELRAKNALEPDVKAKTEPEPALPQQEDRPLLATATTDPSLLPRLTVTPAKEDDLKTLAANAAALPPIPQAAPAPPAGAPQAPTGGTPPKDGGPTRHDSGQTKPSILQRAHSVSWRSGPWLQARLEQPGKDRSHIDEDNGIFMPSLETFG